MAGGPDLVHWVRNTNITGEPSVFKVLQCDLTLQSFLVQHKYKHSVLTVLILKHIQTIGAYVIAVSLNPRRMRKRVTVLVYVCLSVQMISAIIFHILH